MSGKNVKQQEVTREDQTHINSFNKLNATFHELEATIAGKKKILEELDDASNELMLSDEDSVRYVIGESFVHVDKDVADERLTAMTALLTKEVAELSKQLAGIQAEMKGLKATLYSKFGSSINLEE